MRSIEKKKEQLKIKRKKISLLKNKGRRKERAKKLIRLGTLFELENMLESDKNLILGYLLRFAELTLIEEEKLKIKGNTKIEKSRLEKIEAAEIFQGQTKLEAKKRLNKLISVGALFEKVKIHNKDPRILLGYLMGIEDLTKEEKNILTKIGQEEFAKKKERERKPTSDEIVNLFRLAMSCNKDLMQFIWKKYKRKTLESLTLLEYNLIEKELKQD